MSGLSQQPIPPPGGKELSDGEILKRSIDLTIGLIVMVFNIFEIILIARIKRRKKKNYEIVLLSLCVADLLFGLSNAAVCVVFLVDRGEFSVLEIFQTTYFYFVLTSILHLTFIGADRVTAVVKPIKHKIFMTRKKLYVILVLIWVTSTISAVTLYVTNERTDMFKKIEVSVESHSTTIQSINGTTFNITGDAIWTTASTPKGNSIGTLKPSRPTKNQTSPWTKKPPRNRFNSNRTLLRINQQPKLKTPIQKISDNYKTFMQNLLSYFIVAADFLLLFFYVLIIYQVQRRKQMAHTKAQNEQVSIVCVLVAGIFIAFTLPYAIQTLVTNNANFYVNILLVSNSALNSIVYFFRNHCESKTAHKKKDYTDTNSGMTPMTTPIAKRAHLLKSPNVSTAAPSSSSSSKSTASVADLKTTIGSTCQVLENNNADIAN